MIDSSGARRKMEEFKERIKQQQLQALEVARAAAVTSALTRAPSVDEEYNELNAPAGQEAYVPRAGGRSADPDERIRFIKPEDTYIQNIVARPENVELTETSLRFGRISFLEGMSYFSYQNATKGRRGSDGTLYEPYTVTAYFNRFEGGAVGDFLAQASASFEVSANQAPILKPGAERQTFVKTMTKAIRPRQMFTSPQLELDVREAIVSELRSQNQR